MELEINIDKIDINIFFQHLNDNLLKIAKKITTQSTPINSYTKLYIEALIQSKNSSEIKLILEICRDADNIINPIVMNVSEGENEEYWKNKIINETINEVKTHRLSVSTCHLFGYIGPILDGEYIFSDIRLTPAPKQNKLFGDMPTGVEQIVCFYLETTEASHQLALENARIRAKRYAGLLSLFLGVGLYEYDHYDLTHNRKYTKENKKFIWAYIQKCNGEYICESVQSGYDFLSNSAANCSHGTYRSANRNKIERLFYTLGDTLKFPSDIVDLFNAIERLPDEKKSQFDNAAALFQFSEMNKENYPSVALSYAVAAINALIPKSNNKRTKKTSICSNCAKQYKEKQDTDKPLEEKITTIITECFPKISKDLISSLYKGIRCSHLHAGKFPAGEFDTQLFNPFAAIDNSTGASAIRGGYEILRSSLIKWLIIQEQ